jgi:DNA-binding SARP family transcriptional activator
MNRLVKNSNILFLFFVVLSFNFAAAQNKDLVDQDSKIDQVLVEKRKYNSGITVNDKFKIQIFYGNLEDSKKQLSDFKKTFKDFDGTLFFNNPQYKVWVGSFRTRLEAEKQLKLIKKKYPNALLIQPNKNN